MGYRVDENFFNEREKKISNKIEDILDEDENVLLKISPKKKAYIFNAFFQMLPFVLLWIVVDVGFVVGMCFIPDKIPTYVWVIMAIFFAVHLTPVWIWIYKIISAVISHKNIEYAFTQKRIIIKTGLIIDYKNIFYSDISGVNLRVGVLDRLFKVGDIYISSRQTSAILYDIPDPYFILKKIQKIVNDIKTDIIFPNELRPAENNGFKTNYSPDDDK